MDYNSNLPLLRIDKIFKIIFKNNVSLLCLMIKIITKIDLNVADILFIDNEFDGDNVFQKKGILDLFIKSGDYYFNIEMQNVLSDEFIYRKHYYTYLGVSRQVNKGGEYKVDKIISISIIYNRGNRYPASLLNFQQFDRISLESLDRKLIKEKSLIDTFIVNLAYLDKDDRLSKEEKEFFELFSIKGIDEFKKLKNKNKYFKEVYEEMVELTAVDKYIYEGIFRDMKKLDEKMYKRMEREQMGKIKSLDLKKALEEARCEGLLDGEIDGRMEGKIEGRIDCLKEMIVNMIKLNMTVDQISKIVNLSVDEIVNLIGN